MKALAVVCFVFFISVVLGRIDVERLESLFSCKYDSDCTENSFCYGNDGVKYGKCRCKESFVLFNRNRTHFECLTVAEGADSPCSQDLQCEINMGVLAICSGSSKTCKCGDGSHLANDNRCYKNVALGDYCQNDRNCLLGDGTHGYCDVGRCSCKTSHHPSEDNQRCIPSVPLGKSCQVSESCIHTAANCYDGICRCRAGYTESTDWKVCLRAASRVGENCTESIQCSTYIMEAFCHNNVCACRSAHHGYGNECVLDAYLGNPCTQHKECIISAEFEHSVRCTNGVCACVEGVTDQNSYGCTVVSNSTSLSTISIATIILNTFILGWKRYS